MFILSVMMKNERREEYARLNEESVLKRRLMEQKAAGEAAGRRQGRTVGSDHIEGGILSCV